MVVVTEIEEFLKLTNTLPVIDTRSESEFAGGHMPGAFNVPILTNEERREVGITYKQKGKEEAVQVGFDIVGQRFGSILRDAKKVIPARQVCVYCWRGGMRSNITSWILSLAGFKVYLLKGGYKGYRQFVLNELAKKYDYIVLGGPTGTGKTIVLNELKQKGEQVIDIEGMVNHRGSAYGALGMEPQPRYEQFENDLAKELHAFNDKQPVWVENESRLVGKVKIPDAVFNQMLAANVVSVQIPVEFRVQNILKEYGGFPKEELIECTRKVEKRMGNERMRKAIEHIENNEMQRWVEMMLRYYDDAYKFGMSQRDKNKVRQIESDTFDVDALCERLINWRKENYGL